MQYDKTFKEEAVRLSDEIGPKKAAEQRIRELEKENAELKRANEILQEALGFFAVRRKK